MKTLIIYDNSGYIISSINGSYRIPIGLPYVEVEIPEGKQIKVTDGVGVDVSVTPHQVILEDIPLSEVDLLKQQVNDLNLAMASIMGV
jgi:hypothetical protein